MPSSRPRGPDPELPRLAEPGRGWHCFGCGRTGGVRQLAALLTGLDLPLRGRDFLAVEAALIEVYEERLGVAV